MIELNKIYCGDCLEIMKGIPDKCVDLVLTDPPYGIGISNKVGGNNLGRAKDYGEQRWDNEIPSKEAFSEIIRISKNQIIFGGNYFIENLTNSPCWIVWDKDNSGNFADCELAWTSFKTAIRKFRFRWNGMLQEDMKNKEIRLHPTQKPVELFKWILKNYSEEGQTILDPFLGSGTTVVVCKQLNRNFIGIEISEKYCEIARRRLRQEVLL